MFVNNSSFSIACVNFPCSWQWHHPTRAQVDLKLKHHMIYQECIIYQGNTP